MILLQQKLTGQFSPCTYIHGNMWRFEYFFAADLNESELDSLLEKGWRKFGLYYFKPSCISCRKCVPLRILTEEFKPSKSQRRVIKKAENIQVIFKPLEYSDEIFEIYREHSRDRFNQDSDRDNFISSFYERSCPALQSEYYLGDELFAIGFLDRSSNALSSVYFIYKSAFMEYSPGTLSIIREIEYARACGLSYYYLGYYIRENHSMAYKNSFFPNEQYSWDEDNWVKIQG